MAGVAFLLYILAGVTSQGLAGRASLAGVLSIVTSLCALALGVTLYAMTLHVDAELALFGLVCRVVEAIPGDSQVAAIFFAVGSTTFAWLLLRGRLIPVALARLGVFASVLLIVILGLQRAGLAGGPSGWGSSLTWLIWLPMLAFELTFAGWLLTTGGTSAVARAPLA
ncbi:MAG: DUF4386 family protein [Gemmatimonadetes bacterium]|nr:DUF4386 family protein [Gemmatimonadota bacterium]